jgi:hypothetical protein
MSEQIAHLRANAALLYQHARQSAARVPVKARVVLGLFLAATVLMAMYTAFTAKDASLHLKLQHAFHNAQVSVWVDSDLAFAGKITGATKKRFGLIPTASVEGNLSQIIPVRSGQHDIRVRIEPDDAVTQEDKISANFARNTEQTLSVSARRSGLSLSWQGGGNPPAETSSSFAWLWRYASTLFLTGAGSIISALTGFALRELPAHIRARQTSEPKAQSTTAGQ